RAKKRINREEDTRPAFLTNGLLGLPLRLCGFAGGSFAFLRGGDVRQTELAQVVTLALAHGLGVGGLVVVVAAQVEQAMNDVQGQLRLDVAIFRNDPDSLASPAGRPGRSSAGPPGRCPAPLWTPQLPGPHPST